MAGRFAAWRVRPAHRLSAGKEPLEACWLLAKWPAETDHPAKYFFSNLPASTSLRKLVATAKSRWWIEHSDREQCLEAGTDEYLAKPFNCECLWLAVRGAMDHSARRWCDGESLLPE